MGSALAVRQHEDRGAKDFRRIFALVLDGIASQHTRRAYGQALEEFLIWFRSDPDRQFCKATVQSYRAELEAKGLAASSINVRLSAIRRLAAEAGDNGLLPPDIAAGIARAKGVKHGGVRLGRWLTGDQARQLVILPDRTTIKGLRDSAILALLLSAGLRRSEISSLNVEHLQQRDGRWLIVDLHGKRGRIRSVPIPVWTADRVRLWEQTARIQEGPIFRSVTRHGRVESKRLSPQAVFAMITFYADKLGLGIRPHDLRRTFARLAHIGQSPIEQIQLSLGHASVVTTEIYLGVKQNLQDAPCDHLGLEAMPEAYD